jgi:DNA repair exonuclease SbcCD ATPase subunit
VIRILQRLKKRILSIVDKLQHKHKQLEEQLDDHLQSINENTNEIQANYEYLCELDMKIEKLTERLDEIFMFLGWHAKNGYDIRLEPSPLTESEQQVFMVLYTQDDNNITYKDIAAKLNLSENLGTAPF